MRRPGHKDDEELRREEDEEDQEEEEPEEELFLRMLALCPRRLRPEAAAGVRGHGGIQVGAVCRIVGRRPQAAVAGCSQQPFVGLRPQQHFCHRPAAGISADAAAGSASSSGRHRRERAYCIITQSANDFQSVYRSSGRLRTESNDRS